eukprot:2355088-Prymnesium_polylepis.1
MCVSRPMPSASRRTPDVTVTPTAVVQARAGGNGAAAGAAADGASMAPVTTGLALAGDGAGALTSADLIGKPSGGSNGPRPTHARMSSTMS